MDKIFKFALRASLLLFEYADLAFFYSYQNFDAGHNPVMQVPDNLSYRVVRTTTGFTFAGSFAGSTMDDVIASLKGDICIILCINVIQIDDFKMVHFVALCVLS